MIQEIPMRNYAHIGDAVWELFVREYTVLRAPNAKQLHEITTKRVKASFQADLLNMISEELTEEEQDIARRARNTSIPVARRNNQQEYRLSTAFEALLGFWFLNNKQRLDHFFQYFKTLEDFT